MPFEEEEESLDYDYKKQGAKTVGGQKSMFDKNPKKSNKEDFEKKVDQIQEKNASYKQRAAELAIKYKKIIEDKTLVQKKNIFSVELEKDIIAKMIELAVEINNDSNEQEGMGSLSWITLLLKIILSQRDRINYLEYSMLNIEKNIDRKQLSKIIKEELKSIGKKEDNE